MVISTNIRGLSDNLGSESFGFALRAIDKAIWKHKQYKKT